MDIKGISNGSLVKIGNEMAIVLDVVGKGTHTKKGTDPRDWIYVVVQFSDRISHFQIGGHRGYAISGDKFSRTCHKWNVMFGNWLPDAGIIKSFS